MLAKIFLNVSVYINIIVTIIMVSNDSVILSDMFITFLLIQILIFHAKGCLHGK